MDCLLCYIDEIRYSFLGMIKTICKCFLFLELLSELSPRKMAYVSDTPKLVL